MISSLLITIILVASLSSNIHPASNLAFNTSLTRLSSVAIIFSSFLIMNIFYVNILNDGLNIFSGFINISLISQTFLVLLLAISGLILAVIVSNKYLSLSNSKLLVTSRQSYLNNYTLIILFNIIGASFLMNCHDMMLLYIAVETQSFSLYLLSTLKNDSVNSAQAGLRYFLIGSLASTFILLGIALLYYATGLTNFESLYLYLNITDFYSSGGFEGGLSNNSPYVESMDFWNFASFNPFYIVIIFSFVLIITGIFIKLGAAPFHQWAPDVYALVPTPVTAWLVIIPKISLFVLLFNILEMIIGTGNAESYGGFADFIYQILDNNNIIKTFSNNPQVLEQIELNYFSWNLGHITNLYGEATAFYPHFLQIELINSYGTPIINENIYSRYEDFVNSIWNNYYTPRHNLLAYIINITPLGSITIRNFLIFIAIISLIIGAIGGLYQIKIKRLLAFSAINHIGFLIIALSINNKISLESFVFYLTQYSLTNINIFLILIAFGYINYLYPISSNNNNNTFNNPFIQITNKFNKEIFNVKSRISSTSYLSNEKTDLNFINQLTGIFKNNSILTLSFVICLFSTAGIPPLLGFFAKQQILSAALSVGFIFLSIIAINTSVISAFYYLKLIQVSTFSSSNLFSTLFTNKINNNNSSINKTLNTNKTNIFENNTVNKNFNSPFLGISNNKGFITPPYFNSNSSLNKNLSENLNNNNIITLDSLINSDSIESNINLNPKFTNIHSYLISILTLIILFFTLKPNLLLNLSNILTSYSFTL
jgi:NADH:ubiquinone oxidoreductase subunit 2 (subunit N)